MNRFTIIIIILCCYLSPTIALGDDNNIKLIDYLKLQKSSTQKAIDTLINTSISDDDIEQSLVKTKILLDVNSNNLEHFRQLLYSASTELKSELNRKKQLESLQVKPSYPYRDATDEKVAQSQQRSELIQQIKQLLLDNIQLSELYKTQLEKHKKSLENKNLHYAYQKRLNTIKGRELKINKRNIEYYDEIIKIQSSLETAKDIVSLELKLSLFNLKIRLNELKKSLLYIERTVVQADQILVKYTDRINIKTSLSLYSTAQSKLSSIQKQISIMLEHLSIQVEAYNKKGITQYKKEYNKFVQELKNFNANLTKTSKHIESKIIKAKYPYNQLVSGRQQVIQFQLDNWKSVFSSLNSAIVQFFQYLQLVGQQVIDNYHQLNIFTMTIIYCLVLLGLFFIIAGNFLLDMINPKSDRITTHLINTLVLFFKRNRIILTSSLIIFALCYLSKTPFQNYKLLVYLFATWLSFKALIDIARVTLLDRVSDISGKDVLLYRRLRYTFVSGGVITGFMVISYYLGINELGQQFLARFFMIFLLVLSIILYKHNDVIPGLLRPILRRKRVYIKKIVRILSYLIPVTIFINAIIGILGYIDLAWVMSYYQAIFLLVLTAYVLLRGIVTDLLEMTSEWMIKKLVNGWLWTEILLKPIDKLIRIALIILSVMTLFLAYGWDSNSMVVSRIISFFNYRFIDISGVHISFKSVIEFIILLAVFIWCTKWIRELCYRWLYISIKDKGLRNSLSVFSQYLIVIIGAIITLRVLGIEFSGMSFILGGLAVGMGFGLRDFASNIIGGLMLLIERPVREGDLISLGQFEGRVAHIGLRSMRVRSWDNLEVLIPNAETFNKPFTNWTHQDSIVRTVIPIKLQRQDDPVKIQQLIIDVLTIIPEVLEQPNPQVFLKQIDEALIEFEVRYFINIEENSRVEVRSKVLFAIMAQFNTTGVKPPVQPLNIELHNNESRQLTKD
jgi:potassium-dependent mechanosensitive channel